MKKSILFLYFLLLSSLCFSHTNNEVIVKNGISLGSVIAVVISWDKNKSILWAIIHGILGWLFVIYYFLTTNR